MPPQGPLRQPADTPGQPSWIAPIKPVVPDHEILVRIGGGSYGDVWLARSVVGAWRAVKVVFRDRFLDARPYNREFSGIQKFEPLSRSNEGFIDILQIGRNDAEGYFYYVMELADDASEAPEIRPETYVPKTLSKALLQRGRLPVSDCLELGITLNLGLARLHDAGLIHRDIKPSNIIFVGGVPKLADIGLVIEVAEARSYVGTEGFIPPEGPNSPQADLYSLGKVLYEVGMGKDRKDFPEPPTQIAQMPDSAELLEFNAVLLKACAANVKDRYQSAGEMNADLALLQGGGSVRRQRTLTRRLRSVQRAGVLVTALAVVISAGWLWQARQTRLVRRLADEKALLAAEKTKIANENHDRLLRLDIANGVRRLDGDDYSGALLWFAEALPLVTNNPAEESIHRIRIQQVMSQSPSLVQVLSHERAVLSSAFSPDGRRIATGTTKGLRVWDTDSGHLLVGPIDSIRPLASIRYSADGKRLLVSTCFEQTPWQVEPNGSAAVADAATGQELWPRITNAQRVAFSPDDHWLAVARTNFMIEVLDASGGRPILELHGHTNAITMLTFSRDATLLASASQDQTVRLWRVPSGEALGEPIRHEQAVEWVVFDRDGRRLATAEYASEGERHSSVHTWETITGAEIGSPIPVLNMTHALDFDDDAGRRLLVGSGEPWVSVLDTESHLPVCPHLTFESSNVRSWAFSPDGLRFAAGSDDGSLRVWDWETGEPLTPYLRHVGWVESVHFSPDGSRLLTTSEDGTAKVWNLATAAEAMRQFELDERVLPKLLDDGDFAVHGYPRALSNDGKRLLLSTSDSTLRLINLETLSQVGAPMPSPDGTRIGEISSDASGHRWASASGLADGKGDSRNAGLWREEGGEVHRFKLEHPQPVTFIQFSGDGARLWTWCEDHRLRSWQTADGKLLDERELSNNYRWMIAMSIDGARVAMITDRGVIELLDLRKPGDMGRPLPGNPQTNKAAFSPDGTRLATVGADQCGHIWDAETGQPLTLPFKHGGTLLWTEWSHDGRRVLTAGLAGNVKVWDAGTGQPACSLLELWHRSCVAHFSPDGRFIVQRGNEHLARAWDAATAEPITPILHHFGEVRDALITKDNRLVSVSDPSVIRVWDLTETTLPASRISEYARLVSGRKLDRAGAFQGIGSAELGDLFHALLSNRPALFAVTEDQRRQWHRQQIPKPSNFTRVRAAEFHLQRLAELTPADPWVKEQQARLQSFRIPSRDTAAPPNLIDLTSNYTHSLDMPYDKEFESLPRGIQVFAGTQFDVRGAVFLERADPENPPVWGVRNAVKGVAVGRHCRQLHFLEATQGQNGKEGEEVARWVVHYADGSARDCPVLYGEEVRDWCWQKQDPKEARQAVIAWEGQPPKRLAAKGAQSVRLYKATWTNPQPHIQVTSLDFLLSKTRLRPFVVAITAE